MRVSEPLYHSVKDISSKQKVVKYSIIFKDDLLLISKGQGVVVSSRVSHVISTTGSVGKRIGVGCKSGKVMQLRADWLVRPGDRTYFCRSRHSFSCVHFCCIHDEFHSETDKHTCYDDDDIKI